MAYLWIKVFHLLFVIGWLAGIFYLPRIYVHYADGKDAGEDVRRLVIMARKLFGFMTLMFIAALGLGLWLLVYIDFKSAKWIHWKFIFIILLMIYHGICFYYLNKIKKDQPLGKSGKFFRIFNEIPLIFVLIILMLAVFKQPLPQIFMGS